MSVESKLKPVFECVHRPLREGEVPKRRGQKTVYEATGRTDEVVSQLWDSPKINASVTVKHDGQCSKVVNKDGDVIVYRRLDVRKGKTPPSHGVPADHGKPHPLLIGAQAPEEPEFYWIRVDDSFSPEDQRDNGSVQRISAIVPSSNEEGYEMTWLDSSTLDSSTWELIGPKIQGNPYNFEPEIVSVTVSRKGSLREREVPRHYFIKHGSFEVKIPKHIILDLHPATDYIVSNALEGLVIHFSVDEDEEKVAEDSELVAQVTMYKINRGHIGVPISDDGLKITIPTSVGE